MLNPHLDADREHVPEDVEEPVVAKQDADAQPFFWLALSGENYDLLQLSDIAVKALSPSVNDPTTAMLALDRLGEIVAELAGRAFRRPLAADELAPLLEFYEAGHAAGGFDEPAFR